MKASHNPISLFLYKIPLARRSACGAALEPRRRLPIIKRNLVSGAHSVYECVYHIEWCPKYRFNVLRKESSKADMEAILRETAAEHGMRIDELAVMPDHT